MVEIAEACVATTEVKRSKFIAHLVPIDAYKGLQDQLKAQHPKARHVVYALRYFNTYDQVVENSSDDAEPKGCAGLPALNVLRGEELINCAVLIVRYFGGIKLGTGGMVRAYAKSVQAVIAQAELLPYEKQSTYTFESSYSEVNKILHRLKQLDLTHYEREFGTHGVTWHLKGSERVIEAFRE